MKKECEIRLMGSDDILALSPEMVALLVERVRASGTRAFSVPAEELLPRGYAEYLAHVFEANAGTRRRPVDIREVYQKTGGQIKRLCVHERKCFDRVSLRGRRYHTRFCLSASRTLFLLVKEGALCVTYACGGIEEPRKVCVFP